MTLHTKKLVVIIAEANLEPKLAKLVLGCGAHGYTVMDVRGAGSHGERDALWDGDSTIRMEIICEPNIADEIAQRVHKDYFENYAVVLYIGDVVVLRAHKY